MLSSLKKKGVLFYLKVLQVTRKSLIGAILVFSILQIMLFGFLGSLVAGIFLLPEPLEIKIWILLVTCLGLFLIPLILLTYFLSERVWYKASGADEMMDQN